MNLQFKPGNTITCTAPSGGVTSGVPVVIGGLFGIPQTTAAEGESFELLAEGNVYLPKNTSLAISEGDPLYWAASPGEVTKTTSDLFIGGAGSSALSAGTHVWAKLSPYPGTADTSGAVMEGDFGAFSILAADTVDTPASLTVGASTFVGRKSTGGIVAMSLAEARTELNVEDGADVTDATNVNASGAVMESDYNAQTILAATADDTPLPLTVGESKLVGRDAGGNVAAVDLKPQHLAVLAAQIGVPFILEMDATAAAGSVDIFDANCPHKLKILDAWTHCVAANIAGTAKLNNGTVATPGTDITNAIIAAVDKVITRVSTIDHAVSTIAANGSLSVIKNAAGDDPIVYALVVRVA